MSARDWLQQLPERYNLMGLLSGILLVGALGLATLSTFAFSPTPELLALAGVTALCSIASAILAVLDSR